MGEKVKKMSVPLAKRRRSSQSSEVGTLGAEALLGAAEPGEPVGMQTATDLFRWPLSVVEGLTGEGNEAQTLRLTRHLLQGVDLTSDYSGIDCPREAMEYGIKAFKHLTGATMEDTHLPMRVLRTCDCGQLQTRVQMELAESAKPQWCHFSDLRERLPSNAQEWLRAAEPKREDDRATRSQGYQKIADWVMSNRSWLFSREATSFCSIHRRSLEV